MKKILCFLLVIFVCVSLTACAGTASLFTSTNETAANEKEQQNGEDKTVSETEELFKLERIDGSYSGIGYYRDKVTDVMYVGDRMVGNPTVMLDPATGLPLTYARYMEIYNGVDSHFKDGSGTVEYDYGENADFFSGDDIDPGEIEIYGYNNEHYSFENDNTNGDKSTESPKTKEQ